jgi:hypothetical protein
LQLQHLVLRNRGVSYCLVKLNLNLSIEHIALPRHRNILGVGGIIFRVSLPLSSHSATPSQQWSPSPPAAAIASLKPPVPVSASSEICAALEMRARSEADTLARLFRST